jgi:hypothetical protein
MTLVRDLRRIAVSRPARAAPVERCDLCGAEVPADHRHLLQLEERQILCACASCCTLLSDDPKLRPTGTRVLWLAEFDLQHEVWAEFRIPIGLAFFFESAAAGGIVALYPSPAGATESELDLAAWQELAAANPVLATLEPDVEALIVNRLSEPPQFAIAPIDRCYALVGLVKRSWEGISGGSALAAAVEDFFAALRRDTS